MIKLFSLLILFSMTHTYSQCHLNKKNEYVFLSGPLIVYLNELGILSDRQVVGVSSLYGDLAPKKVKRYLGGIHLAQKTLNAFDNKVTFFDYSVEREAMLKKNKNSKHFIVQWEGLSVYESLKKVKSSLEKYLVDCEKQHSQIFNRYQKIKEQIKKFQHKSKYLFFLGPLEGKKYPETLMVNDGFLIDLRQWGVQTYPSDLAYVPWSEKKMQEIQGIHVGMNSLLHREKSTTQKISKTSYNITGSYLLIPGVGQLSLIEQFAQLLKEFGDV